MAKASFPNFDLNHDGYFNISDAVCIQKYLAEKLKFNKKQLLAADFNNDGTVDITDSRFLQKLFAKMNKTLS